MGRRNLLLYIMQWAGLVILCLIIFNELSGKKLLISVIAATIIAVILIREGFRESPFRRNNRKTN